MGGAPKLGLALVVASLLATGLAACGGGSDSTGSTAGAATAATADKGAPPSAEGSAGFRTPGGDNSIQNFGEEADAAEVEAATSTLAPYLAARAKNEWAQECAYLAKSAVVPLERLASSSPQLKGKDCAAILAAILSGASSSTADTAADGIASLRVEGDRAFALYHGARGIDFFVPMVKENGKWKVGALAPSEFP
jgi:hypothetical protein